MGMKTIADIYEKLKVDDIVLTKEFPMDGTLDDISLKLFYPGDIHFLN